jgi:LEA14-like dessication related protein
MKEFFSISGLFILLLIIAGFILIKFYPKKLIWLVVPEVERIGDININLADDWAHLSSQLTVVNKSFFTITIDSIRYSLKLMDQEYIHHEKYLGLSLKPSASDTVNFSIDIPLEELIRDLKEERKSGDSMNYAVNLSLVYSTLFGNAKLPLNKTAKIKIPRPPDLELTGIKYHKLHLDHFDADISLNIINYNNIEMTISDLKYLIRIHDAAEVSGIYKEPVHIKALSESGVILPIRVEMKNVGAAFLKIIANNDKYKYTLKANGNVDLLSPKQETFHVNLMKEGVMELKK